MKNIIKSILIISIFAFLVGCTTSRANSINSDTVIANPNNVYRFSENTVLKVMIQDKKSGQWKVYDKRVLIPIGYYIGSGIE